MLRELGRRYFRRWLEDRDHEIEVAPIAREILAEARASGRVSGAIVRDDFDPVHVPRALARHGLLKHGKGRFTYAEPFQGKRNKRFHVLTAKILASDYDRTPEDAPDDEDGAPEDAPDEDGVSERRKRSPY